MKIEYGRNLIVPLSVKEEFLESFEKIKAKNKEYIHTINHINIQFSPYLEGYKWSGKWISKYDKFVQYNIDNPSDWEIYFGFVEKEMIINVYSYGNTSFVYNRD